MPIVLNEKKQAENIIKKGEVGNKPTSTLFLLAKYYRQEKGYSATETFDELNLFMEKNYKNFNKATWEDIIENISKKANKYPLRQINSIEITKNEIEIIKKVGNVKYEKLLFTMLCYAKLYNVISDRNNGWVNTDIKEIFRIARVTVKYRNDKFLYLNDLESTGFISFSNKNDNLNIKVNFFDSNYEEDDVILKINDFRELGYEYLDYIGDGKYIRCECCDRLVKKTNNKCLYCNECAKQIKNEQNKAYYNKKQI